MKRFPGGVLVLVCLIGPRCYGQETGPKSLTLQDAESYAVAHHPEIQAADLRARAAGQDVRIARSFLFPQLFGDSEAVVAGDSTRLAAIGGLNNPTVLQRQSNGLLVNQLITDFGYTSALTASARYEAVSAEHTADSVRTRILLEVDRAFFSALNAQALLRVADQTVDARSLILDRVNALANAKLKSSLDVSFAEVALGEAKLMRLRAEDGLETARAQLATALGNRSPEPFSLVEEPLHSPAPEDIDELLRTAFAERPDLLAIRATRESAQKLAVAERAGRYPVLSAEGAAGFSPYRPSQSQLGQSYGAAGLNLTIPLFTGGRLEARAQAAILRADAASNALTEEENQIERDVRVAWLNARTAYQAIEVSAQLLESAKRSLELAESRYNLGVSSMVELSQAELQETEAEIANTTARYEYQIRRADLDFEIGRRP